MKFGHLQLSYFRVTEGAHSIVTPTEAGKSKSLS
jgi:hypothetical protein